MSHIQVSAEHVRSVQRPLRPERVPQQIIALLQRAGDITGHQPHQLFEDWVRFCEYLLVDLSNEASVPWAGLRSRYAPRWQDVAYLFRDAFLVLQRAAQYEIRDYMGAIFHQWELANHWRGQYFTPWEVALMTAQMQDPTPKIHIRLKAALLHPDNDIGQVLLLSSLLLDAVAARRFFVERLIPAALPFYTPVTIHEPCVGSGVMLLAVAAVVPWWANDYRLIRYTGQDVDALCVSMAHTQLMLFGLTKDGNYEHA